MPLGKNDITSRVTFWVCGNQMKIALAALKNIKNGSFEKIDENKNMFEILSTEINRFWIDNWCNYYGFITAIAVTEHNICKYKNYYLNYF